MLANEKDYIATRTAHKLNLTGPAVSVHTACSTSLVAIAQAFDALRGGQCGLALAGGSSITCPPNSGYLYQEGSMLSPDGHTRSFDAMRKARSSRTARRSCCSSACRTRSPTATPSTP